eukprot:3382330-Heterocapsa_arctica.AAC.1
MSPVETRERAGGSPGACPPEEEQDRAYLEKAENQNISERATRSREGVCGCGAAEEAGGGAGREA